VRLVETSTRSGIRPSIDSVGDAYGDALAETTIKRYKSECIRADSSVRRDPLRALAHVGHITADYVASHPAALMHSPGRVPPAEAGWYSQGVTDRPEHRTPRVHETCMKLGMVQPSVLPHQRLMILRNRISRLP
jgi:putative transposase